MIATDGEHKWLRNVAFSLGGGVALGLAQPPYGLSLLGLAALAPVLAAARTSHFAMALLYGCIAGTAHGLATSVWIVPSVQNLGGTIGNGLAAWFAVSVVVKAPALGAAALTIRVLRKSSSVAQIAGVATSVCLGEALWEDALVHAPWAPLATTQLSFSGVAQLAVVTQSPLLVSALVGACNAALAIVLSSERGEDNGAASALAGAWFALAALGVATAGAFRSEVSPIVDTQKADTDANSIRALIVQPNFPRGERWNETMQLLHLRSITRVTMRALRDTGDSVDVIVWPENLLTTPVESNEVLHASLTRAVDSFGVPLVTGLVRQDARKEPQPAGSYRNAALWWLPQVGIISEIEKMRPVPLIEGEASEALQTLAEGIFGDAARTSKAVRASAASPLSGPISFVLLICHEALFPNLTKIRRARDAAAIVTIADDGWSSGTAATRQLVEFARYRAIEQRLPLIRVAHGGVSVVVDEYGRILEELPRDAPATLLVTLRRVAPASVAERTAILFLPALGAGVVWWARGRLRGHLIRTATR